MKTPREPMTELDEVRWRCFGHKGCGCRTPKECLVFTDKWASMSGLEEHVSFWFWLWQLTKDALALVALIVILIGVYVLRVAYIEY